MWGSGFESGSDKAACFKTRLTPSFGLILTLLEHNCPRFVSLVKLSTILMKGIDPSNSSPFKAPEVQLCQQIPRRK
ncbi:hypothetical protein AVEN_123397-1 [Araneus ventricosus]|uniref:Uncharacterized protein n=1 Tax=Araneus ventricosus TaxID=182803 RepID=A0A4Y2LMC9_ARAVE|nr:hypothetical protein AVEN_123397-1 [Araneus ventricosus]